MLTVFAVDDEPAAILYLRKLIRLTEDFEIIGEFGDGASCLSRLEEEQPDVIISDIRMPGMSGLDFLKRVNERFPDITYLLLSGYSEFEYAREAIKLRVCEYLLKPILPDEFTAAMNRIRIAVTGRYLKERDTLLRSMCRGGAVKTENLERYFGTGRYFGILIRKNGLPRENEKETERTISSELYEPITVYGCDEREALCLIPENCMSAGEIADTGRRMRKGMEVEGDLFTTVLTGHAFTVEEMADVIQKMYRRMYQALILGKERTFYLEEPFVQRELSREGRSLVERIQELLAKGSRGEAYLEFEKLCREFETQEIPESMIRHTIRYLLQTFWMFLDEKVDWEEQRNLLDQLFYESATVQDLCGNLRELFAIGEPAAVGKIDTEENYQRIRNYIVKHYKDPLSLSRLSREFGISQAYLTKMFRKYQGMSFNSFFTNVRMEEAKKLLLLHPDWYIKDIAEMVGYQDQFYFSRVFRTYTGYSPSDYILSQESAAEYR